MSTSSHRIPGSAGSLALSAFAPSGAARGVVVGGHAMMCDRRTLDQPAGAGLASTLAAAGFHTYTFDARGHGESAAAEFSYDDLLDDLASVVAWVKARHPGLPLAVVGHSLMGHGALLWLGQAAPSQAAAVQAVVALAANVWVPALEPARPRWWLKRAVLEVMLAVARLYGRFPARALGLGSADVALPYVADFVRWARQGGCRRRDGRDYLIGLARVRIPVLAVLAEDDRLLCHPACGQRFADLLPAAEVRLVSGVGHMGLVTSARSASLWTAIAGWLTAALPSGIAGT